MNFYNGVLIPDVSFHQDDNNTPQQVDFVKMKSAGAAGVIIRVGQNSWVDPDFRYNYAAAKAAGLPRGVYWFFDSRTSPLSQALICATQIGDDYPELGTWLDLEENYGGPYLGWRNWMQCLAALKSKLPRVGVYTAPYYWMLNRPQDAESLAYFKSFELWIANYNVSAPLVPSPWSSWVFWQYGTPAEGQKYGAESIEIDMNRFNGDENLFRNYFDLGEPTTPPEQEQPMARYTVTLPTTSRVALRPQPNTGNTPHVYITAGTVLASDSIFTATEELRNAFDVPYQKPGDVWAQVSWGGFTGWVAVTHLGLSYCTLTDNGPQEPPPAGHVVEVYIDGVLEYRKEL